MTYIPYITSTRISKDYGYIIDGYINTNIKTVEMYDDTANTWVFKQSTTSDGYGSGGFNLNDYGYIISEDHEKYDNILNIWSAITAMVVLRYESSIFTLNGYGYAAGGNDGAHTNETDKYDDILNTWTAKATITSRKSLSGFAINGHGYAVGGKDAAVTGVSEKYDDVLNTWTSIGTIAATESMGSFDLDSYGYTFGGWTDNRVNTSRKYDDINNTWTSKAAISASNYSLSGFKVNNYGYCIGGNTTGGTVATTQKYDSILNTWTSKTDCNTARRLHGTFSLGSVHTGIHNPDIDQIIRHSNNEIISVDQTASRAINGTAYTNTNSYNKYVTVSARCVIDTAADVANIQAFSDTNADPVAAVSGIVGIEGGLSGEDVSVELSFIVRPYYKYKVVSTTSTGCTTTIGKWFETPLK